MGTQREIGAAMGEASLASVKVEELLKEVRVDYSQTKYVEDSVKKLKEFLLALPESQISSSLSPKFVSDLSVPEDKCCFKFLKPESVAIIGSFSTESVAKPVQNVDIAIRIPKACFHEKDFLNYRYHAKRFLYLAAVELELSRAGLFEKLEWTSFAEDFSKPILTLHLGDSSAGSKFALRLIPTISLEYFDMSKFGFERNNVRRVKSKEGTSLPTPHYSSCIVEDMLIEELSKWLQTRISKTSALRDAVCLAKVWLRQRSVSGYHYGINGFLMSLLIVHLSSPAGNSRISGHMSALQMFRVTLDAIGNGDILGGGIEMQKVKNQGGFLDLKLVESSFQVVMVDPFAYLNLTHRLTKSAAAELKDDALRTLDAMKASGDDGFDDVFMTPVGFAGKYDYHVRCPWGDSAEPLFLDGESWRFYERKTEAVLKKALADRAISVRVLPRIVPGGWTPALGLECVRKVPMLAGILLNNADVAFRLADVGPAADDKEEARKFRAFWGEKSELRRFKDGKISETAVWECEPTQRHLIIERIIHYAFKRHLALSPEEVKVVSGQLDFAISVRGKDPVLVMPKILEVYETLSKRLRSMEDLPLRVVSVQPVSSEFRYAAVYFPQPHVLANELTKSTMLSHELGACLEPLEVVIQFEGSGRWPDAPIAIKKTKLAFCLDIARRMEEKWRVFCVASEEAVDILMGGFAFRLYILYEKDRTFVNKSITACSKEATPRQSIPGVLNVGPENLADDLLLRSMHASMLQGLHGLYPAFGPTVRLAKRWIGSHLFSGVVAEEAVELLVAHVFVKFGAFPRPASRITGFLRFLCLLAKFDWLLAPLIVDVNGTITSDDEQAIAMNFRQLSRVSSEKCEGPAMYIASPHDSFSQTWTRKSPSCKDLKRLVSYAKSSSALLTNLIMNEEPSVKWQSLFRTPLNCYDAVVLLHEQSLPHPSRLLFRMDLDVPAAVTKKAPRDVLPVISPTAMKAGALAARNYLLIGFNPIECFVGDLKERVGSSWSIFYDHLGSNVLGLTRFRTSVKRKQEGKIDDSVDMETLVRHLSEAGEGLIRSIHHKSDSVVKGGMDVRADLLAIRESKKLKRTKSSGERNMRSKLQNSVPAGNGEIDIRAEVSAIREPKKPKRTKADRIKKSKRKADKRTCK